MVSDLELDGNLRPLSPGEESSASVEGSREAPSPGTRASSETADQRHPPEPAVPGQDPGAGSGAQASNLRGRSRLREQPASSPEEHEHEGQPRSSLAWFCFRQKKSMDSSPLVSFSQFFSRRLDPGLGFREELEQQLAVEGGDERDHLEQGGCGDEAGEGHGVRVCSPGSNRNSTDGDIAFSFGRSVSRTESPLKKSLVRSAEDVPPQTIGVLDGGAGERPGDDPPAELAGAVGGDPAMGEAPAPAP